MDKVKLPMTEHQFTMLTGRAPRQDDLERVNCPHVGKPGHWHCGWNHKEQAPCFEAGPEREV